MDLNLIGHELTKEIKSSAWFPFRSGTLKFHATSGRLIKDNVFRINFSSQVAPYVRFLEEGTQPHDIPFAFVGKGNWVWWYPYKDGVPFLMGMGGRFNGKFHPGSTKHKGFISVKSVNTVIDFFVNNFGGEVL